MNKYSSIPTKMTTLFSWAYYLLEIRYRIKLHIMYRVRSNALKTTLFFYSAIIIMINFMIYVSLLWSRDLWASDTEEACSEKQIIYTTISLFLHSWALNVYECSRGRKSVQMGFKECSLDLFEYLTGEFSKPNT